MYIIGHCQLSPPLGMYTGSNELEMANTHESTTQCFDTTGPNIQHQMCESEAILKNFVTVKGIIVSGHIQQLDTEQQPQQQLSLWELH